MPWGPLAPFHPPHTTTTAAMFIVLLWLISAGFAAQIASAKNHDAISWFFAGLFFGPLGLLAACGLPDRTARN